MDALCAALSRSPQPYFFCQHVQDVDLIGWEPLASIICNAYTNIMGNYVPGDELFIFGFSRGAIAARALANLVARIGVLLVEGLDTGQHWQEAMTAMLNGKLDTFKVKKINPNEDYGVAEDLTPRAYNVDIEVVGCWDTVANLSSKYKHLDTRLVKGIKHAFHALALDECRGSFTPRLWHMPDDPEVAKSIDLQQCWFPGAHNNVGGGYGDVALSSITLAWMMDRCRPFLDYNPKFFKEFFAEARRPGERILKPGKYDTEYQGWGRGMCYDSYWEGHAWTWKTRTPGAYGGGANETMHSSVRERWRSSREHGLTTEPAVWNPKALEGFSPRQKEDSDEWEWVKDGGTALTIPEAPFPTATESVEWQLRYAPVPSTGRKTMSVTDYYKHPSS